MTSLRHRFENDERGFVLAVLAISLVVLVLMIGFAVDLGSWYLRASKIQRASDLASLSAASALPDVDESKTIARDTLAKNGFVPGGSISVTTDATATTVTTTVKDSKVPTYFISMLFRSISIQRSSSAEKQSAIPLGNPYNIFGSGTLNVGPDAPPQHFWAAINGICAPKEDGDLFAAKWDANKTFTKHNCNPPASQRNPSFRDGAFNGYSYLVDVPANAGPVSIDVFDAQHSSTEGVADLNLGGSADLAPIAMNTSFSVYDTKGTIEEADDGPALSAHRFQDGESPGRAVWYRLFSESAGVTGTRQYKVKVYMDPSGNGNAGLDVNAYSLMASVGGNRIGCDTRKSPSTCPKVYGLGAVSVYDDAGASKEASFYLAELGPERAGDTFDAYLWDAGEGAESIELLAPDNTPMPFTWSVTPTTNLSSAASGTGTLLDVSGVGPQPAAGIQGQSKYNDRLITLRFKVPNPYSQVLANNSDYWWKLRYKFGSAPSTDRMTFGVKSGSSSPAHLSK